ncbi:hypothetical protein [Endozoicomonas lisbonensis]|uniref:hypothetical protein n=1 Tax=Endozoicomonas lisbonensis TaxID=3120522 RepID=UPI0033919764
MENLTKQQKANRVYYAKNAERIKAQKREAYSKGRKIKPKAVRSTQSKPKPKKTSIESHAPVPKNNGVSKLEARRRLEDLRIAKELGLEVF